MGEIYLDNAATTKAMPESVKLMTEILSEDYGNPSSIHLKGYQAEKHLIYARDNVSKAIGANFKDIIFTSGGTEANNLAIMGALSANRRLGKHIITTEIEHSSVSNVFSYLEYDEFKVTRLKSDENGLISLDELKENIREDTVLVSIMYVNNETGAIQPVEKAAELIKEINKNCIFHVDGIQAVGKLPLNLKRTKIDIMTGSGHKFHAPKGVGFLYNNNIVKLNPIIFGGGQEQGKRSGTENMPGIAAMGNSIKVVCENLDDNYKRLKKIKNDFANRLLTIEDTVINGGLDDNFSPYILNVSFKYVKAEVLIHALEEKKIFVSSSSACSSHSNAKSPVLLSMGLDDDSIDSAIRFSFSKDTTEEDLKETFNAISELVPQLRKFRRK